MDGSILAPKGSALSVRRLDRGDLEAVMDLNAAQGDVMRHDKPDSYNASFRASLEAHYLGDKDRCALFGAYCGERLDACVSVYLWTTFPYYSTGNLKVRLGTTNLFSRTVTPLGLCVQTVLQFAESRGYLRGYMVRAADHWPVDRVVRSLERSVPELRRYHREIELRVPKGTKPAFPFVWSLMGQRLWDHDLVVEAVSLSEAARSALPLT
ncbi:MAG: hypothetical protein Q8K93_32200 [Reyranella sp.]|uniref:hypothetical protein n=1 Tax=Reyranella sp. TaxID=1929291 RepID=UPI00272F2DF6|nr:hypothetical protein [Reyranella sp.]MDP1966855.1 hypothetical protein [Reyranella sp.]MDP2376933.1 hypothetical protein [Reyranella sp.]